MCWNTRMCLGRGSWTDERDDDAWDVSVTHRDLGCFLPWWQLCSAAPPATPPGPSAARGRPGRRRRTGSSEPGRRLRPPEGAGQTFSSSLCFFSYSFAGGTRLLTIPPVQLVHTCATGKVSVSGAADWEGGPGPRDPKNGSTRNEISIVPTR